MKKIPLKIVILTVVLVITIVVVTFNNNFVFINGKIYSRSAKSVCIYDKDADYDDLAKLSELTKLETLELHAAEIDHVGFVGTMHDLKSIKLDLPYLSGTYGMGAIDKCSELEYAYINCNVMYDLGNLVYCYKLKELHMDNVHYISGMELKGMENLQQLEALYIKSNFSSLNTIEFVRGPKHLKTLSIDIDQYDCRFEDISPVGDLTELTSLTLKNTFAEDISPVYNCKELTYLDLSNNRNVSDISGIDKLQKLEELNIAGTAAEDFEPLLKIDSLKKVTFSSSDSQLESVKKLEEKGVKVEFDAAAKHGAVTG